MRWARLAADFSASQLFREIGQVTMIFINLFVSVILFIFIMFYRTFRFRGRVEQALAHYKNLPKISQALFSTRLTSHHEDFPGQILKNRDFILSDSKNCKVYDIQSTN